MGKTGDRTYRVIDRIIEGGIYLYIIMMFLSKGESIRSVLIYGNFALWLFTIKHRKNLHLLKEPVSRLCWMYLGVTIISVIFSIDPLYSLMRLKMDPLIFAALFPVIATVMSDQARLMRVTYVCLFTAVFISLIGYYSYIFHDIHLLKPDIALMHVYHNKFAKYLNTLLPIAFTLFLVWKRPVLKIVLSVSAVILIFALVLNTSRGGYVSFISMSLIWSVYMARSKGYKITRIVAIVTASVLLIGAVSFVLLPDVKNRVSASPFNDRRNAWTAAVYGFMQRPVLGWGYGKKIFHKDEPFRNTPLKISPHNIEDGTQYDDPHNVFLMILFHQGIIGLFFYTILILLSIKIFWKKASRTEGVRSYMLVACVSVLVGNYIMHSIVSLVDLKYLAVVLALGMAADGSDETSNKEGTDILP